MADAAFLGEARRAHHPQKPDRTDSRSHVQELRRDSRKSLPLVDHVTANFIITPTAINTELDPILIS